jgi:hypothetical protein
MYTIVLTGQYCSTVCIMGKPSTVRKDCLSEGTPRLIQLLNRSNENIAHYPPICLGHAMEEVLYCI